MPMKFMALLLVVAGCSISSAPSNSAALPDAAGNVDQARSQPADLLPTNRLVTDFPYDYKVPASYEPHRPTPLVILLHGARLNGAAQDSYFNLGKLVDGKGFLFAYPDANDTGQVDDVEYLEAVISDMTARYNVDPKRIYLVGHSDGGFLSHDYACTHARQIAAIVSLAGSNQKDCQADSPVAVLQVHGDMDAIIDYNGRGSLFPSAYDSVATWGVISGCRATPDRGVAMLDLDQVAPGKETVIDRWVDCQPGGAAELWTMRGVGHIPIFYYPDWPEGVWNWLAAHPKP